MPNIIRVTFDKPRNGYWDGGLRSGGDFEIDNPIFGWGRGYYPAPKHPSDRWGCLELNFFFTVRQNANGDSTRNAYAWIKRHIIPPAKIQLIKNEL